MITDERKKELRFKIWVLAQYVLMDTAYTRTSMPSVTDEEYEYAREFMIHIAESTKPGNYREPDE